MLSSNISESVSTAERDLWIFLVRTPTSLSSSSFACVIRFWVASRTELKVSNSFFTVPKTFQTSAERFWTASVLKPI